MIAPETVQAVIAAWTDAGSHPDYHDAQKRRLRREWPVLYRALTQLATARKTGPHVDSDDLST